MESSGCGKTRGRRSRRARPIRRLNENSPSVIVANSAAIAKAAARPRAVDRGLKSLTINRASDQQPAPSPAQRHVRLDRLAGAVQVAPGLLHVEPNGVQLVAL